MKYFKNLGHGVHIALAALYAAQLCKCKEIQIIMIIYKRLAETSKSSEVVPRTAELLILLATGEWIFWPDE